MLLIRRTMTLCLMLGILSCGHSPQAYVETGNKFAAEHRYQEASIQYRKALQKDPKFGEAVYRLALSEVEQQNVREGYNLLLRAVDMMPDNQEAKVKLADLSFAVFWADSRRPKMAYDKAVQLANELVAKDPNSFDGLRLKGAQAMLDRQPKIAAEYYKKANDIKPMQAGLIPELVQALQADGQERSAEHLAREFISREPANNRIYSILYQQYSKENRSADAEDLLKTQVRNKPGDAQSRLQLATHYARTSKPDEMKAILQGLLNDAKTFPKARLQVAEFYSGLGDWRDALEQYEQGAQLNPPDKLSYEKGIVNSLVALGKREEAAKRLDALVKAYPKNLEIKIIQSSIWLLSGQPGQINAAVAHHHSAGG